MQPLTVLGETSRPDLRHKPSPMCPATRLRQRFTMAAARKFSIWREFPPKTRSSVSTTIADTFKTGANFYHQSGHLSRDDGLRLSASYADGEEIYQYADQPFTPGNLLLVPTENDSSIQQQWNLRWTTWIKAWRFTTGSGDVVLVSLDSGLPVQITSNTNQFDLTALTRPSPTPYRCNWKDPTRKTARRTGVNHAESSRSVSCRRRPTTISASPESIGSSAASCWSAGGEWNKCYIAQITIRPRIYSQQFKQD